MSKEIKKLTLTDLIKEKEKYQVKADTKQDYFLERLGASITIRKPERSLYLESMQMLQDEELKGKADIFMVYNIVVEPNLKDSELQKAYGCIEPYDIVEKIFEPGEINLIAGAGLGLAGYHSELKKVEDLKN